MKKNTRRFISSWVLILIVPYGAIAQLTVTSTAPPPVSSLIHQLFSQAGAGIHATLIYPASPVHVLVNYKSPKVRISCRLQRLSPAPFTIELNNDSTLGAFIYPLQGQVRPLTKPELEQAFGNFQEANLTFSGITPAEVNDKLPDGIYNICFIAHSSKYIVNCCFTNSCTANFCQPLPYESAPGCTSFTICYKAEAAPQFTQPVSNLNINSEISVVQPSSPVVFTWTPPRSSCGLPPGGYTYDFEIRELLANQGVTDAINNPFVFRKTSLPSTTFLLDANLYKNVLEEGKRYVIRVRAVSTNLNSPLEIDNNGYSRVEAFQYGGNVITQNGIHEPGDYLIPFKERKGDMWDDVYTAYKNHKRSDTLVPVKEYIAFALTQNGTAYNSDAIELFLALNPDLADVKKVKISYTPKLPVFPTIPADEQVSFDKERQANLEPDKAEENKFLKYLDTLNNYKQKVPGDAVNMINDLVSYLNNIKTQVSSIDRVTVNFINNVLSELLYELHQYAGKLNKAQSNQLQNLVSALRELTAESPNSTSLLYPFTGQWRSSLSSYQSNTGEPIKKISWVDFASMVNKADDPDHLLAVIMKQLLRFDVIVYRNSKVAPFNPVFIAPDLKATYSVFYTLSNLYNAKNPEINAKNIPDLASTVQVSLPSNLAFQFWTLNMLNQKMTRAQEVDLRNVLSHNIKISATKKLSIILKVD